MTYIPLHFKASDSTNIHTHAHMQHAHTLTHIKHTCTYTHARKHANTLTHISIDARKYTSTHAYTQTHTTRGASHSATTHRFTTIFGTYTHTHMHARTYAVLARLYALPRINTLPPLRGLSYCAGFLSRIHACVCTYVAQSFYSSIMSNNIKKIYGKEVDSLSLST